MQYAKSTKITLKEDWPVGISSAAHGANLDSVGFNMSFIRSRSPHLAMEIMKLFENARKLKDDR